MVLRYRLEDPRGLRASKSPYCSPRGSLSMEIAQRLLRKTELRERSYSDDTQSDSGSPELCFLHPDHAWHANSRRGSSQSEQLEVEPYELNRDYSRSLPGSRRSSFQSQGGTDSKREWPHSLSIPWYLSLTSFYLLLSQRENRKHLILLSNELYFSTIFGEKILCILWNSRLWKQIINTRHNWNHVYFVLRLLKMWKYFWQN